MPDEAQVQWFSTDPSVFIELGTETGYKDTNVSSWQLSYAELYKSLSVPDQANFSKDGPGFVIGPCNGRRSASNIPYGFVAVIDADKSIDPNTREEVEGAPPPMQVHEALKGFNISHCLYTSHSHGTKGNRYRIVIPVITHDKLQLQAVVQYVIELLQTHANLPLALSRESYTWGQRWNLPRIAFETADFYSASHFGIVPNPQWLVDSYGLTARVRSPKVFVDSNPEYGSPMRYIEKCLPVTWQLEQAGYTFVSQGIILDLSGMEATALRFRPPGSTGSAGVVVFESNGRWLCYSHHTSDVLNNGYSNDAFDVFKLLNGIVDEQQALFLLLDPIHEYVVDEMNANFPSIMEGGYRFRWGNVVTTDLGAVEYRLMDSASFFSLLKNQAPVPIKILTKEGTPVLTSIDRARFWEGCSKRINFNGLVYQPHALGGKPEKTIYRNDRPYFNLFRDWHLKPVKGKWPTLEWHLRNAICGGVESEYQYLLTWFADFFQNPSEKSGIAMVLQSSRGTGKTLLFSELAKKISSHAIVVGNNKLLTGGFNHHMRNKLLMVVEESFWAGSHKEKGILQHIITDPLTSFEKKGVDAEQGISMLRVVMITNEDWAAPASSDERRFFIPSVCTASKDLDIVNGKKGHFFPKLIAEMRNGGLEAFAYDMARRPVEDGYLRTLPNTTKLMQQKLLSIDEAEAWLLDALSNGVIEYGDNQFLTITETQTIVSFSVIGESLVKKNTGRNGSLDSRKRASALLQKLGNGELVRRRRVATGIEYVFGPLSKLREAFEVYVNAKIEWPPEDLTTEMKLVNMDFGNARPN